MHSRPDALSAFGMLVLGVGAGAVPALAQTDDSELRFTFGGGYTYRLPTDLDTGGDVSVSTLSAGLNIARDFNRDVGLTFRINYGVSIYDFGGSAPPVGFGVIDPWDDIHTLAVGAAISADINDKWSVFGGPVFQISGESGADWEDAVTGGVIAGATYAVSDDLVIGGGIGIVSQIEDNVRFFPIIIVEWNIEENWRVSSRGPTGGRSSIEFTGVELIWQPGDHWEFAVGGGSSYARFRLDDEDVAPDGVGQDESTPVWLRASWMPTSQINLDVIGGFGFGGELTLDDEDGDSVAGSDTDEMSPFIGLFGSIRF